MSDLEELFKLWEQDSKIDMTEPGRELLRIPNLHAKYNQLLSMHRLSAERCSIEYNKLRKVKWLYYFGKLEKDELERRGWEQFLEKIIVKSDVNIWLDGDDDLCKILSKRVYHDECSSFCTYVMKELNSRTFQLRSFIDHEKFRQGG